MMSKSKKKNRRVSLTFEGICKIDVSTIKYCKVGDAGSNAFEAIDEKGQGEKILPLPSGARVNLFISAPSESTT